jgi:hypothetical protein
MANKQQTAVCYLISELKKSPMGRSMFHFMIDEFTKSLQMEREQIEQAYGDGLNAHRTDFCNRVEYYNQTYAD